MIDAEAPNMPDPVVAHLLRLAHDAAQRGDLTVAEQICTSVVAIDPRQTAAHLFLVTRALDAGDPQRACELSRQALEHSSAAQLHFLHGHALFVRGRMQE